MRSTTFALLGLTTAIGLGLVAIVSQQGFSPLPGLPLPGLSPEQGRVHDATRVQVAPTARRPGRAPATAPASRAGTEDRQRRRLSSDLAGSRQLATASPPASGEAPTGSQVVEEPVAAPAPVQPAPETPSSAAPSPAAAAATPVATQGSPAAPAATVSNTTPSGNSQGNAYGGSKSSKGKSANHVPAPAPAPPSSPAAVSEPAVPPSPAGATPGKSNGNGNGNAYGHSK